MTRLRNTLLAGAALILAPAAGAGAADLNGGSLKDNYVPVQTITSAPRWYVRVDGGIAFFDRPFMSITDSSGYTQDLTDTRIDRQWSVGGGVGAYIGRSARFDITAEHRFNTDVNGTFVYTDAGTGTAYSVRSTNTLRSTLLLANVYYDFNRGSHFSPYLGVGLGAVYHEVGAGSFSSACGCATGTIDGNSNWHVAGALMAGADFKLRDRLHLDAGYRFLYLGHTSTGATRANFSAPGSGTTTPIPVAQDPTIEQLHAHEFRLGLRYDIQ